MKPIPSFGTALLVTCFAALPTPAQDRVEIRTPYPAEFAAMLEQKGFALVEGSVDIDSFELIVNDAEQLWLERRGLKPIVVQEERPLRDILAERAAQNPMSGPAASYKEYPEVVDFLLGIAAQNPSICRAYDLTHKYGLQPTFEGRSIWAVKISDNVGQEEDEPAFLMVSGYHSGEIVNPVIAMDAIDRLTAGYGSDPQITAAVDGNEIWIAPVWNPDGYAHVFAASVNWRKNRRVFPQGIGVDLNRNYAFGWFSGCSGTSTVSGSTYKGPNPGSEAETQHMLAFTLDQRFAKVLDYHSSGRETLWSYSGSQCFNHVFDSWLQAEAIAISQASGYGGKNRRASAVGEHYQWQLSEFGRYSFLTETHTSQQPSFQSAVTEAARVWPGTLFMLERPITVSGRVTDAATGQPLAARIVFPGLYTNHEGNSSGGPHGRYEAFLPPGSYTMRFLVPGYSPQTRSFTVPDNSTALVIDVAMSD